MAQGIEQIKVQTTRRNDGRITVTLKLIGYDQSRLTSLEYQPKLLEQVLNAIRDAAYIV